MHSLCIGADRLEKLDRMAAQYNSKAEFRETFLREVLEFLPQFALRCEKDASAVNVGALQVLIKKNEAIIEDILAKVYLLARFPFSSSTYPFLLLPPAYYLYVASPFFFLPFSLTNM